MRSLLQVVYSMLFLPLRKKKCEEATVTKEQRHSKTKPNQSASDNQLLRLEHEDMEQSATL
jgi:hypothetical protein